jgi:thioredoxin-like negative regulator of GroEL
VNISEDENVLWKTFNIDIVPTIVVFKDGKPILRKDGAPGLGLSEDAIKETIEQMKLLDREN